MKDLVPILTKMIEIHPFSFDVLICKWSKAIWFTSFYITSGKNQHNGKYQINFII